jgi:hypothetical protein
LAADTYIPHTSNKSSHEKEEEEEIRASCLDHPILLSWVGKILHSQISCVFRNSPTNKAQEMWERIWDEGEN